MKMMKYIEGNMYVYERFKLIDKYSEMLAQKMEPFDFRNPPIDPSFLAVSLLETMYHYKGIGLSANQVGLPYRVFVMGTENSSYICFNPEIISAEGVDKFSEGCLSYPGLYLPIERSAAIAVRYYTEKGKEVLQNFVGLTARIFQHELEHMDGKKFTDNVNPLILHRSQKKIKNNIRKLKAQSRAAVSS